MINPSTNNTFLPNVVISPNLIDAFITISNIRPKKGLRFLVSARVAADPHVGIFILYFILFYFFAMKRCPIAAKIAGSIGILPCCALNDFFT